MVFQESKNLFSMFQGSWPYNSANSLTTYEFSIRNDVHISVQCHEHSTGQLNG